MVIILDPRMNISCWNMFSDINLSILSYFFRARKSWPIYLIYLTIDSYILNLHVQRANFKLCFILILSQRFGTKRAACSINRDHIDTLPLLIELRQIMIMRISWGHGFQNLVLFSEVHPAPIFANFPTALCWIIPTRV